MPRNNGREDDTTRMTVPLKRSYSVSDTRVCYEDYANMPRNNGRGDDTRRMTVSINRSPSVSYTKVFNEHYANMPRNNVGANCGNLLDSGEYHDMSKKVDFGLS